MNAQCPRKWWSTLKSAVFGSSLDSSLPHLIWGVVAWSLVSLRKAEMLSSDFEGKQSKDHVDQ